MAFDNSRIGIVSDEIHEDPEIAFRVANELGLGHVDLNSLWGKAVTDLDAQEVQQVGELADRFGLRVTMVAGLPFKSIRIAGRRPEELLASAEYLAHMRMLERSMEIAQALKAPIVRIHSFAWTPPADASPTDPLPRFPDGGEIAPGDLDCIVAGLRPACDLARKYDVILGHENVRSIHGNSGRNTALILDAVGDDRLKVVWDPANAYAAGEEDAITQGYEAVREHMVHFHIKDVRVVDRENHVASWVFVGDGGVDYAEHFKDVMRDYDGVWTLEPHWREEGMTPEEASRITFDRVMGILRGLGE